MSRHTSRPWPCLLALLLLLQGCGDDKPKGWVARLTAVKGKVLGAPRAGARLVPADKGTYFVTGGRLETGAAGEARLELRNGGALTVESSSVLLFKASKDDSRINLTLERGTVLSDGTEVKASELMITVGGKRVRLGARARARLMARKGEQGSVVDVAYGEALVEGPGGKTRTIVAGQNMVLTTAAAPDAGVPDARPAEPDAEVEAPTVYFLRSVGRGRVQIRRPGERRFRRVRRRRWLEVAPGTQIRLARRAAIRFGPEKGKGTVLTGPGLMLVTEGGATEQRRSGLKHLQGEIKLADAGKPGKKIASFQIDGVTIYPRVTYRRVDVRIRRKPGKRAVVTVNAGAARLVGKEGEVQLEAGHEATISGGTISGPRLPPPAPFQVRHFGTVRVFVNDPRLPVTFRWPEGGGGKSLVRVARRPSLKRPLFADVISRDRLTLRGVSRGSVYWSVSPVDPASGEPGEARRGRLVLVRDTSFKRLAGLRTPKNTIHHHYGNTTVYYQNRLPSFIFNWKPMDGAARYHFKLFRENNLRKPLVSRKLRQTALKLGPGKLGEGGYIWYVAGRASGGELVKSLKSNKLSVRFDNATPDIQIIHPRNGLAVGAASVVTRGVTDPGSKVYVNGAAAELDEARRFKHKVGLKPGTNYIIYRVVKPRRGSSYYLRRVIRR